MKYVRRFLKSFPEVSESSAAENLVRLAREGGTLGAFRATAPTALEDTYFFFGDLLTGKYHFSQDLKAFFGLPPEKPFLAVTELADRMPNEVDRRLRDKAIRALIDGAPQMVEHFRVKIDGHVYWVCTRCARIYSNKKDSIYVCGSIEFSSDQRILTELFQFTQNGEQLQAVLRMLMHAAPGSRPIVLDLSSSMEFGREDIVNLVAQRMSQSNASTESVLDACVSCRHSLVALLKPEVSDGTGEVQKLLADELDAIGLPRSLWSEPKIFEPVQDAAHRTAGMLEVIRFLEPSAEPECDEKLLTLSEALELFTCIKNDFSGFELQFQPIVSQREKTVCAGELLIRFRAPNLKLGPQKFIPILEKTAFAIPLGRWTFEEAIRAASALGAEHEDLRIGFNVSPIQLDDPLYYNFMMQSLRLAGISAKRFIIEITEASEVRSIESLSQFLHKCRGSGMKTAIDDFGSGYNSLEILLGAPFDEVKFGRTLTTKALRSRESMAFFGRLIEACRALGVTTCVEGVELPEELERLDELAPDLYQGWFFSRPLRIEDAVGHLVMRRPDSTHFHPNLINSNN